MNFENSKEYHNVCIICGYSKLKNLYTVNSYNIVKCTSCSFQFVADKININELEEFYENDASEKDDITYTDTDNVTNLNNYYTRLSKLINRKIDCGKILDIGCNAGYFLDCMDGWERHGVELVSEQADIAKEKYGDKIFNGFYLSLCYFHFYVFIPLSAGDHFSPYFGWQSIF